MVLNTHNPYFDNMFSAIRSKYFMVHLKSRYLLVSVAECGTRQSDFSHISFILQMLITQRQISKLMVFDSNVFTAIWYKPLVNFSVIDDMVSWSLTDILVSQCFGHDLGQIGFKKKYPCCTVKTLLNVCGRCTVVKLNISPVSTNLKT